MEANTLWWLRTPAAFNSGAITSSQIYTFVTSVYPLDTVRSSPYRRLAARGRGGSGSANTLKTRKTNSRSRMMANRGFADLFHSGSEASKVPSCGVLGSRTMKKLTNLGACTGRGIALQFQSVIVGPRQ